MKEESRDINIYKSLTESLSNMISVIDRMAIIGVSPCENERIGFAYVYLTAYSTSLLLLDIETTVYNYCKKHDIWLNRSDIGSSDLISIGTFSFVIRSEEDAYKLLAVLKLEGY